MSNEKLREFSEWLDTYRDLPVHEVFHEIVLRYEEALSLPTWGDKPAVNQQLTTGPVDDLPDDMGSLADYFGDLAQQKADLDASRGVSMPVSYYASTVVAAALAWQARAAMAKGET